MRGMKLLIGLGNPGEKFKNNRHNVGHMFVDFAKTGLKTNVFMNDSGSFVKGKEDFVIVHDDLDLPLGRYKIQFGKGPELHYGIQSIENELGTKDFWRIRIGVDDRGPNNRESGESYVLKDFTAEEKKILESVFDAIKKNLASGENLARGAR